VADDRGALAEQHGVLEAFARSIGREAHNLSSHPELTWQQLYNDVQWAVDGGSGDALARLLGEALEIRETRNPGPWLRLLTRPRRSSGLVAVLRGHRHSVEACASSPDGSRVVSGG
jgi:WD40 repeat protein